MILLAAIAGVPVLLALVFRVNAVFLYLSVAAGNLLVMSVADDADLALGMVASNVNTRMAASFGLLLAPVLLTLLFLRKTMSRSKMLFHILPIIGSGLMLAAFALPFLSVNARAQVYDSTYGEIIDSAQDVVIGAATLLTLFLAWFSYRNKDGKRRGRK